MEADVGNAVVPGTKRPKACEELRRTPDPVNVPRTLGAMEALDSGLRRSTADLCHLEDEQSDPKQQLLA